ncbi:bifunctional hydroxymethylpyrimidine kinase/phosphomethylpyrimidine kinase [Dialister sp.]|uniref:bifunctional hydroxymethylpyrimidine kinase/phosphomethylpyrimidine kinase n=1 Tax=Dialister sp. TaxID=1955814 RepID=UPI002E815597|nr:bifunctional hydroxymethylpyrimidine kinase/phosphomethylpyrimidine kinase [Dialister sp.]MEE3452298.1 bifunctional hydroxymethylpyrimidine kinase/phosphomethylpyrimidine kinase [Dialister sp.]
MGRKLLLINDLPGYGKVALSAMMPVLTHMGHEIFNLPTALVSNTLDYGRFEILDTTNYMRNTIGVWKALGFSFDGIATGFITSPLQAAMIANYCRKEREKGTKIFVDPIMGDEGHLYNGLTFRTVEGMKKLISNADYMVPNYTEACLLTNTPYHAGGIGWMDMKRILGKLYMMSNGSVAITSAKVDGKDAVAGYDTVQREFFLRTFDLIPVRFPGTGDIFSAIFMGSVMNGISMMDSVDKAMIAVRKMIVMSQDVKDNFKGIPVENCLEVLD